MTHSDLENVQAEIAKWEDVKKTAETVKRLKANTDYQFIIDKLYLNEHLNTLVQSLAIVSSEASVQQTNRQIAGIGGFKHFIETLENMGKQAEHELDIHYQTLREIQLGGTDE